MREIQAQEIVQAVSALCVEANHTLPGDIIESLEKAASSEISPAGKSALKLLHENAVIAKRERRPICQDTGMAVVFLELGQDIHVVGGSLYEAVNEGVRRGYAEGYLRLSIVRDPLIRENTGDNTPAVIHTEIVPGDRLHITVSPKGFGSENMSAVKMFTPSAGRDQIMDFVVDTVSRAGSNPCPPVIVGVGIGGTMDKAAQIAKKALTRDIDVPNSNPFYAELEKTLLEKINKLGIGPQGMGGTTTALAVNVETFPTHIAGLPVAVNVNCHATRHTVEII